jgi:hypothetical protein
VRNNLLQQQRFEVLTEASLMQCFFPRHIFHAASPNFEVYSRLCKEVNDERANMPAQWTALAAFAAVNADYCNEDFLNNVSDYVLSLEEGEDEAQLKTTRLDVLGMLVFACNAARKNDARL